MDPISFLVGTVVGFVGGVTYGRARNQPWSDMRNSAIETALEIQRAFKKGPTAPEKTEEPDPA